jgi:hypothetical protein
LFTGCKIKKLQGVVESAGFNKKKRRVERNTPTTTWQQLRHAIALALQDLH